MSTKQLSIDCLVSCTRCKFMTSFACSLELFTFWFLPVCRAAFYTMKAWNTCSRCASLWSLWPCHHKTSTSSSSSTTKPKCYHKNLACTLQCLHSIYTTCILIYAASILALSHMPYNLSCLSHSHIIERSFLQPVVYTESDVTSTLPLVILHLSNSAQCSEGYGLCSPISDESWLCVLKQEGGLTIVHH